MGAAHRGAPSRSSGSDRRLIAKRIGPRLGLPRLWRSRPRRTHPSRGSTMTATETPPPPPPPPHRPISGEIAARAVHASKVYGAGDTEVRALDNITVDFERSRFTAIMGPSGSGKSTLLHCLAGLDSLSSGSIFLGDIEITALREKELTKVRRDHIGFVFQTFNLIPTLTALENIELPMSLAGTKPDQPWLDSIIDIVRLRDRLHHRPSELSGGQQQRVAVARALA